MSIERRCPNCFRKEGTRYNFGNDREAEKAFHQEKGVIVGTIHLKK